MKFELLETFTSPLGLRYKPASRIHVAMSYPDDPDLTDVELGTVNKDIVLRLIEAYKTGGEDNTILNDEQDEAVEAIMMDVHEDVEFPVSIVVSAITGRGYAEGRIVSDQPNYVAAVGNDEEGFVNAIFANSPEVAKREGMARRYSSELMWRGR